MKFNNNFFILFQLKMILNSLKDLFFYIKNLTQINLLKSSIMINMYEFSSNLIVLMELNKSKQKNSKDIMVKMPNMEKKKI